MAALCVPPRLPPPSAPIPTHSRHIPTLHRRPFTPPFRTVPPPPDHHHPTPPPITTYYYYVFG
eukprot:203372-Prymnesium_polylepis.1